MTQERHTFSDAQRQRIEPSMPPCKGRPGAAAGVLYLIASGKAGFELNDGLASNGYGKHSPGGCTMTAALVTEFVMTFFFLMIILGATDERAPSGFAPIDIGLALTLIHLISIPITNTSVNPARSTGPAIFVGGWALSQLWLFWVVPLLGAGAAGVVVSVRHAPRPANAGRWLAEQGARSSPPRRRMPAKPARPVQAARRDAAGQ